MNSTLQKQIFFHVGTGKTGTTFLQYRVFPKLKGIHYIQRTRYKKAKRIIDRSNYKKYLLSREFDQQLEEEVTKFASVYPNTTPIIVFRRHDDYIASQYRRFVKNGFKGRFVEFFNLENDQGYFKKQDLDYFRQIQILEKYFKPKPIVLFFDDLRTNPHAFIDTLSANLDVTVERKKINFKRKHTSYSEKQLKAIMNVGKYVNLRKRRIFKNSLLHLFWRFYLGSIRYTTLYVSKFIPAKYFNKEPLIPENELDKIKVYFQADWQRCLEYSKNITQ